MAHPPPPTRFTLTRARPADAPRIAEIHLAAMDANPLLHAQFPSPASLARLRQFLEGEVSEHVAVLSDGLSPSSSTEGGSVSEGQGGGGGGILVARDVERGVIVGFIRWDVEVKSDSPGNAENTKAKLESGDIRFVEGCRPEFLDGYAALAEEAKKRCFGEKNYYCLTFVCIGPAWQGRGAGALLTRHVLDLAAADGLPVYLESTEVAVPLYRKLGFRVLDGFEMRIPQPRPVVGSIAEVGGDEEEVWYREKCMVWTPPSKSEGDA